MPLMHARFGMAAIVAAVLLAGCGDSPTAPAPTPTPGPVVAAATPAPAPTPAVVPTPEPCTQGLCEAPTTNTNTAVRLTLRVYVVVNQGGEVVPGLTEKTGFPVGYTVTVDATAKDNANKDTLGNNPITWTFDNKAAAAIGGNHTNQRRVTGGKPGIVEVTAQQDGVASNTVQLLFE